MNSRFVIAAGLILLAAPLSAGSRRLTASSVKTKPLFGQLLLTNDSKSISVFQFEGNIRNALFTLRSIRSLATRPYGSVVYNTAGQVKAAPEYLALIMQEAGARHGIDPRLVAAVAMRESRYNPNAVSPVGAQGVMQLMPATAQYLGVQNSFDARENVFAGAQYLKELLTTFHGDLELTLAAYNAGPGAVQKHGGVPPYRETVNYIAAVKSYYEAALHK